MLRVGRRLLLVAVILLIKPAEGERRAELRSGQRECGQQEVKVLPGQQQWLVSPGHVWPGVANGTQTTCLWTIKAPPGNGIMVEIVRLRIRRSRRCSASRLEVVPAGSVVRGRVRPLAKFCGRNPKIRQWKTTFSEVNIEYKRSQRLLGRDRQAARPADSQGGAVTSPPMSQAALDRAEKLKRIKVLHRLYQLKTRENRRFQGIKKEEHQPDSIKYNHHRRNQEYSGGHRFYRHLNGLDTNHLNRVGIDDLLLEGDRFIYDMESNTYGTTTAYRHSLGVRLLGVGEPAWFNYDFILRSGRNDTKSSQEHHVVDLTLEHEWDFQTRSNTSKVLNNQDLTNQAMESEGGDSEKYQLSSIVSPEAHGRRTPRDNARRSRQYTVSYGFHAPYRQQHHISAKNNLQDLFASTASSSPDSRGHNEIIPNKPAKLAQHSGSDVLKNIGYKNTEIPSETLNRRKHSQRDRGDRWWMKRDFFVLKVSTFRSGCGGEVEAANGRFSNPDYPRKTVEKGSCSWRFKTPARSHWKLTCNDFLIRKSRDCRRDHLAIRINDAHWSRYCGREGPSLGLTSSHHASVDVVLNTFRNRSARVMCSWETSRIDDRGSPRHLAYDRYWSYNLTVATATTTTTTTTTTTLPPPPALQTRSCRDYRHLTQEHTMCRSTPPSCALYQEGVKGSDRQAILDSHNIYRAKVARGEESQGLPGPQYSAADMQQLAWNEELAQVAQSWASTCPDYHDCHDCRKLLSRSYYVGQNIFYEWSSTSAGSVWDLAVRLWYEEVKYVPNYLTKSFRSMDHAVIGHYTQLVWAETREVGCGAAYHDCSKVFKGRSWKLKCKIYVCNYGPTGNFLNKPMYTIGPAASACPEGSRPSAQHSGLCTSH